MKTKKIQQLVKKAKGGDVEAIYDLSYIYYDEKGAKENLRMVNYWALKAAQLGHIYSQVNIGMSYYNGLGIKVDFCKIDWRNMSVNEV